MILIKIRLYGIRITSSVTNKYLGHTSPDNEKPKEQHSTAEGMTQYDPKTSV